LAGGSFAKFGPQLSFDCNCFHFMLFYLFNRQTLKGSLLTLRFAIRFFNIVEY
jgi:hypothetical protein